MSRAGGRALRALADRLGILPAYRAVGGRRRLTTDDTRRALLAALGVDAASERAAAAALAALERDEAARLCEPVAVAPAARRRSQVLVARVPPGGRGAKYQLAITDEAGARHVRDGRLSGAPGGRVRLALQSISRAGYYRVQLEVSTGRAALAAEQMLVVPPSGCPQPADLLGRPLAFGITANLYALRSEPNWGVGDLTDLAELGRWAAGRGAAFLAINPLHALLNRDGAVSPYSPVSRLFRNPLYLDPTAVPGFAECDEARRWLADGGRAAELERLRRSDRIDYAAVMAIKRRVLEALHRQGAPAERGYTQYLAEQGEALTEFATYLTLVERFGPARRAWPAEWRRPPGGAAAAAYRRAHATEIAYHCWAQYQLDRQLAAAAASTGLELGLFGDLAVGDAPDGADTWAAPDRFIGGASLGAPPDPYSAVGQDWGLIPLDPRILVVRRCDYWIRLVRGALRHMGGLRLDHVMGLFRQFWIPAGGRASEGAYVRYPAEPLLAILALESSRAGAVIVGEDLGTVPRGLPAVLRRWGILSTRLLYFERRGAEFRAARQYSRRALVTVSTHDHAPLAGYWQGRDLDLRHAIGDIQSPRRFATARAARERDRRALLRRLAAERILPRPEAPESGAALAAAVHTFLARTPAPLIGLALDDLVGETEPMNLPGVGLHRYPGWQRRTTLPLGRLAVAAEVREAMGDQRRRTPRRDPA